MGWERKDLLGLADLGGDEIRLILDTAEAFAEIVGRTVKKLPTLRGKTMVNMFYEPSTRTRTSFELAEKWLSADVINISPSTSSAVKGENLLDTGRTLQALGADVVVIRHASAGAPEFLARHLDLRIINAGDGGHEHPTQGLLDLFTIRQKKRSLEGLTVTIVGDIRHSRVARSDIWGLKHMGAKVRLAGPPTLIPPEMRDWGVEVFYRLEPALEGADVVNILRLQRERQAGGLLPSLQEYSALWGLNHQRLKMLRDDTLIMHPGPANIGVEITEEAATDPRSVIREQVTNGVAVRMAVLYLMGGGRDDVDSGRAGD